MILPSIVHSYYPVQRYRFLVLYFAELLLLFRYFTATKEQEAQRDDEKDGKKASSFNHISIVLAKSL